jgi:hypothetical protein
MTPNEDFFHARYFMGVLGGFTSPDPANAGADILNPQSWNAYAYVRGNPLGNVDPTGACDVFIRGAMALAPVPASQSSYERFQSAARVCIGIRVRARHRDNGCRKCDHSA